MLFFTHGQIRESALGIVKLDAKAFEDAFNTFQFRFECIELDQFALEGSDPHIGRLKLGI